MTKSIRAVGVTLGLATLLSSCQSPISQTPIRQGYLEAETYYQRPAIVHKSEGLDEIELKRVTGKDVRHERKRIVINGLDLYIESNENPLPNEENFLFIPQNEVHLRRSPTRTKEISDFVYIPTRVIDSNDNIKTEIKLNPSGKYAVKAHIREHDTRNIQSGLVVEREGDIVYNIRSSEFAENEWYTPVVEKAKRSDSALLFYLTKYEDTELDIERSTGNITLINPNGMFRPIKVSRTDYNARKPPKKTTITLPINNTGEALESQNTTRF